MDDNGFVFIPNSCFGGSVQCHLHVHFHGCGMERCVVSEKNKRAVDIFFSGWLGDNFIQNSGFLPVAEENHVIVIFPQVMYCILYSPESEGFADPPFLGQS